MTETEILKDCRCINSHDAGVILIAIDHMRQSRENSIREIKKQMWEKSVIEYQVSLYEEEIKELNDTRKRLTNTPTC